MSRLPRPGAPERTSRSAAQATQMGRRAAAGLALAAVALPVVALAGCGGGAIGQDTPLSEGQGYVSGHGSELIKAGSRPAAPDISGKTLTGAHLSLASYRGQVVVLNFWGSWCGPCRAEAPGLAALAARYRSRGVRFLGIDIQDEPASAEAFMHTFQISYPSLNDPGDELALAFRSTVPAQDIPTTLVIDRTSHIAGRIEGGASYDALRAMITQVLAEHQGAAR